MSKLYAFGNKLTGPGEYTERPIDVEKKKKKNLSVGDENLHSLMGEGQCMYVVSSSAGAKFQSCPLWVVLLGMGGGIASGTRRHPAPLPEYSLWNVGKKRTW